MFSYTHFVQLLFIVCFVSFYSVQKSFVQLGREDISIGNHAMLLVQLGINSSRARVVWKFCRRGESNLANFQTSRALLIPNCTSNIA
jgi:hypothetical protein